MNNLKLSDILEYFQINEEEKVSLSEIAFDHSLHMRDKESYKNPAYDNAWEIYNDISDYILYSEIEVQRKIHLLFETFELFPTYAHSMLAIFHIVADGSIQKQSEDFQEYFWKKMISYFLHENNAYRFASDYLLGIELLESELTIPYTWKSIQEYGGDTFKINELLLRNSSAVDMDMKVDLYKRLIGNTDYHSLILKSMYFSAFGYYWSFSISKALPFIGRLKNINMSSEEAWMIAWFISTKEKTLFHRWKE